MATPIKYHLDQLVANAVAHGLRQLGIDVTTTHDAGFLRRHAIGEHHAGIGYAPQTKYRRNPGGLIRAAHDLFVRMSADEMTGRVEFL